MTLSDARHRGRPDQDAHSSDGARILLVIGVHREELAFGDQLVSGLAGQMIDVLRIPSGLSARRPRADQLADYRANHASLYDQIGDHLQPAHEIMIDLHCSVGACPDMDIICADTGFLQMLREACGHTKGLRDAILRTIQMVSDEDLRDHDRFEDEAQLFMKPDLPPSIWKARKPLYVGLEIYLQEEGAGTPRDWQLGRSLIQLIGQSGVRA